MIETILSILGSAGTIWVDKLSKEWPEEVAELETIIMEQKRLEPEDRDMRRYDDAKRRAYIMHEKVQLLMKEQAAKK